MQLRRFILVVLGLWLGLIASAENKTVCFNVVAKGKINKTELIKTLKKEAGTRSVKINVKEAMLTITYDDTKTSPEKFMGILAALGYYASPLGENCAAKPGGCLNNKPVIPNSMK